MLEAKTTLMDRIRENRIVRTTLAIVFTLALAIPSTVLATSQAYAASDTVTLERDGTWINYGDYRTAKMEANDIPVYCAEPDVTSPPQAGTYSTEDITPQTNSEGHTNSIETVAAMLYFGYGGPGFDKSMWPDTWYDGSEMTASNYWALTHILVSAAYTASWANAFNNLDNQDAYDYLQNIVRYDADNGEFDGGLWYYFVSLRDQVPQSFIDSCYQINAGNDVQIVLSYLPFGYVELTKTSGNTDITDGNDCYDLSGAQYGIYSDSSCTDLVTTITTNANGYAKSDALSLGTYYVKETKAATGYALDETVYTVKVTAGATVSVNGGTVTDQPQNDPGVIVIGKYDGEYEYRANNLPQGSATLAGAEFTVTYYDGYYESAEEAGYTSADDAGDYTRQWVFATDDSGRIYLTSDYFVSGDAIYYDSYGNETFPLGTYIIQETKAPEGYNLNDEINVRQVTSEGTFESVDTYNTPEVSDKVKRGDVEFQKMNANSSERMANIPFLVTSITTGESHVIMTDENGYFSSSNSYNQHSYNTNGNDAALIDNGDGTYSVDESLLDSTYGVYFGMNSEGEAVPQVTDEYGAFPYDTYIIQELRCSGNEGLQLVSDTFTITREDFTIDLGSIDDPNAYISTVATDEVDGDHYIVADPNSTVVDTISYTGLVEGRNYTLETTLVDLNDDNNVVTTATTDFTAKKANGTETVKLAVDTTTLVDHDLAIVEVLYDENGDEIASHNEDLDESEQMVTVISSTISTTALDSIDGDQTIIIDDDVTVVDTINTTNFIPGETYVAYGELMRILTDDEGNYLTNEDGSYQVEPFTVDGEAVTATTEFTADAASESIEQTFNFDSTEYQGETVSVVVYETISKADGSWTVCTENDPANTDQTFTLVPSSISTYATDGLDGNKTLVADGDSSFVDTIQYKNLIVGETYTFGGIIMDADTHMPVLFGDTDDIDTSRVQEFMNALCDALHIDRIDFVTDSADDESTTEDEDSSDEDDSIIDTIIDVFTGGDSESESENSSYVLGYDSTATIDFDAVSQVLVDYSDIVDHLAISTQEVTVDHSNGSVEVSFDGLDSSQLAGTNTVVLELLVKGDRIITTHTDFDDSDQQVEIVESTIGTTLVDATDGDNIILPSTETTVVDTVTYENLIPGKEYELTGTLMTIDEATGQETPLYDAQGNEVTATTTFVPNNSYGTTEVEFTFDSTELAEGQKVVAFEYLYKDDVLVATHADIDDESQTVWVTSAPIGDTSGSGYDKTGETILPYLIAIFVLLAASAATGTYAYRKHKLASGEEDSTNDSNTSSLE